MVAFASMTAMAERFAGFWTTADDESKEKKSVVQVYVHEGKYYGRIVKLFKNQDAVAKLPGSPKICGLDIIWDMKKDGDTLDGGWSLTPDQLLIGATRLFYPFFAGLILSRLHASIRIRKGGFALSSAVIAAALAMPYFEPASSPWVNGLYEAVVIMAIFPLVVVMGAGSQGGGRFCRFLDEISYPVYIMHFPLAYMQMAWVKAHASAPVAQHVAVNVSIFALAFAVAWAAQKLYDMPVRAWLSKKCG